MPITAKKQSKSKEHEMKTGTKKKTRSRTLENREKPNLKLFIILKSPQFLKGPIFIAIGDKSYVTRYQMVASVNDLLLD